MTDIYAPSVAFLTSLDADWSRAVNLVGPCRLSVKAARTPYESLMRAIAYQQLSTRVGDVLIERLKALGDDSFPAPERIVEAGPEAIRGCGFSANKTLTLLAIAEGALSGLVPDPEAAASLSDEDLIARLTAIRGIGRWTVEMLLIFTLGRPDILPVDDLGVREGYRHLKGLTERPKPATLRETGAAWAPHRTVASWYLWRLPEALKAPRLP